MSDIMGVYQIRCLINDYVYIGGSEHGVHRRWAVHVSTLRKGTHHNKVLQRDWNKFGERSFVLEVLVKCRKKNTVRVQEHRLLHSRFGQSCYNRQPSAFNATGTKFDTENHAARSASAKARCTTEWRNEVSARVKRQHTQGKFGSATWTEETRSVVSRKISESLKGRTGPAHPKFGKRATPEQRERYRQAATERERLKREARSV